jgi:alkylation response protein AidB-like acyl-CoA dehydrogenase
VRRISTVPTFSFLPYELPPETAALRLEIREFLSDALSELSPAVRARTWMAASRDFTRRLGARGFIGMTWPKKYGGHERSMAERYVVIEELLVAGAPVAAHWIADRQSGPLLLRFGSEEQRQKILPGIARGETCICIGMSEPNSGSDLASVRTRARRVDGGFAISGHKIWTSYAHIADYMIALVRTTDGERQAGLSQILIDMKTLGITVRPIINIAGDHDFNEVFLEDVFVPETAIIGQEGNGWAQVNAELAFERSGPERYLSSLRAFVEYLRVVGEKPTEAERLLIGRFTAELWTLRQMSLSVAGKLARGENPATDAAIVKDLGTSLEQEMPRALQGLLPEGGELAADSPMEQTLGYLLPGVASFSLRGGTREILRGIIARELGLR